MANYIDSKGGTVQNGSYRTTLKTFKVTLGEKNVDPAHVTDIRIEYNIHSPCVFGTMAMTLDSGDILEKDKFEGNQRVVISCRDNNGFLMQSSFIAYGAEFVKLGVDSSGVFYYLMDELSFEAKKQSVSLGLKNVSIKDILEHDKTFKPLYEKFNKKEKKFDDINDKLETFTVYPHEKLYDLQNHIKNYFNVLIYQTRKYYKIQKWENIFKNEVPQYAGQNVRYIQNGNSLSNDFAFRDPKVVQADSLTQLNQLPVSAIFSYDMSNRSLKNMMHDMDIKKLTESLGSNNSPTDISSGISYKAQRFVDPEKQIKSILENRLYDNNKVIVEVPGCFCVNVGDCVELKLTGNEGSSETLSENHVVISKIVDLFEQGHYRQQLTFVKPAIGK